MLLMHGVTMKFVSHVFFNCHKFTPVNLYSLCDLEQVSFHTLHDGFINKF